MIAARSLQVLRGARAKALRPRPMGELLATTRALVEAFRIATADHVARADDEAERGLRRAAAALLSSLKLEKCRVPCPLPRELGQDLERWEGDLFEGTDVDVEVADHALFVLSEGEESSAW